MSDVVTPEKRSQMMAGIRSANTKPEMTVRRGLHRKGFRYLLNARGLPGRPDLVFPKYHAIIFIHGCFWHGHDCRFFKWPKSNAEFWRTKILLNQARDKAAAQKLKQLNWRVATIWECAIKNASKKSIDDVLNQCEAWLEFGAGNLQVRGSGEARAII